MILVEYFMTMSETITNMGSVILNFGTKIHFRSFNVGIDKTNKQNKWKANKQAKIQIKKKKKKQEKHSFVWTPMHLSTFKNSEF